MSKSIYIYVRPQLMTAHGVQVIVRQIEKKIGDVEVIGNLGDAPTGSTVLPYGVLESVELIKMRKHYPLSLSLLVDAYSLGEISKLGYFWNKPYIPLKHRLRGGLKFLKFFLYEWLVLKYYKRIMLVSWGDKHYYERNLCTRKYSSKIVVILNGIEQQSGRPLYVRKDEKELRIGCLSPWNESSFATLQLFLNDIWAKLPSREGMRLIIAGRNLTEIRKSYLLQYDNVEIMGEVKNLAEFYDAIDVSLLTMVKKCGIINRILDAFAYQVPVITRPQSLLAFKEPLTCCYQYYNAETFLHAVNDVIKNPEEVRGKVKAAKEFSIKDLDWQKNYLRFEELLK